MSTSYFNSFIFIYSYSNITCYYFLKSNLNMKINTHIYIVYLFILQNCLTLAEFTTKFGLVHWIDCFSFLFNPLHYLVLVYFLIIWVLIRFFPVEFNPDCFSLILIKHKFLPFSTLVLVHTPLINLLNIPVSILIT